MNKTKKRFLAFTTAFVMAFALVATVIPATVANAEVVPPEGKTTPITNINVNLSVPEVGKTVRNVRDFKTYFKADMTPGQHASVNSDTFPCDDRGNFNDSTPFDIVAGQTYYGYFDVVSAEADATTRSEYYFDPSKVTVNLSNGEVVMVKNTMIYDETTGEDKPDYTVIRVWFKYTPQGAAAVEEAAPAPQETPTPAPTTTTTAKTNSPKTGDAVPFVAVTLVIAGTSAIGIVLFRRRMSR